MRILIEERAAIPAWSSALRAGRRLRRPGAASGALRRGDGEDGGVPGQDGGEERIARDRVGVRIRAALERAEGDVRHAVPSQELVRDPGVPAGVDLPDRVQALLDLGVV